LVQQALGSKRELVEDKSGSTRQLEASQQGSLLQICTKATIVQCSFKAQLYQQEAYLQQGLLSVESLVWSLGSLQPSCILHATTN
jgi:hypothetical protein